VAQRRPLANGTMGVLAPMPTWVDTTVLLTGTHMPSPRLQPSSLALPRAFEHLQRSAAQRGLWTNRRSVALGRSDADIGAAIIAAARESREE
jgi:hypothetical protein